jgi:hypothetical protein
MMPAQLLAIQRYILLFDIADFTAAILTLNGFFEIVDVLDEDKMAPVFDNPGFPELTEHPV